ncbi:MAG: peptidogalycan biosysnthesis protein, partial [Rubrivivax sp.]
MKYRIQVHESPEEISAHAWDALLALQARPTPFMRHAYLRALHASGSACAATGWAPRFMTLHTGDGLQAAV